MGWDRPVTACVTQHLLPDGVEGSADLSDLLVIVPTRQAGRRLRESLARACAERGVGLFPPRVETSAFFMTPATSVMNEASPMAVRAAWADVLMHADLVRYPTLFPADVPDQDFVWAMQVAGMIESLRDRLVDAGCLLVDVLRNHDEVLSERDRWRDLAGLEERYLERLDRIGLQDSCALKINTARTPMLPEGINRMVVAAVPDPTAPMVQAVETLAETKAVEILIHAPEELAERFDDRGRPEPSEWAAAVIDIPRAGEDLLLAGSPLSQSDKVLGFLAGEAERWGAADVAIGVPDANVTPTLLARLEEYGLHGFDPAGRALTEHSLFQLVDCYRAMMVDDDYAAVHGFFRHADVLALIVREAGIEAGALLENLDRFQNDFVPQGWSDIERRVARHGKDYPALATAAPLVSELVRKEARRPVEAALREVLLRVYGERVLRPNEPADEAFRSVAGMVCEALDELAQPYWKKLRLPQPERLELLAQHLAGSRYYPEKPEAVIDLEGWLELPWNDAPFLVVTGMNEGAVPDGHLADGFLPDALCGLLGLRDDEGRLARDAFLLSGLIESRRAEGRVGLIAGKTSTAGDPLKPSRLLFRCPEEDLSARAALLCGTPEEPRDHRPASISFALDPAAAFAGGAGPACPDVLNVTTFRDYLACPFRYYLGRVLQMQSLADEKQEMDALDFGNMMHWVLQQMALDAAMKVCTDPDELGEFFWNEAQGWVTRRFGSSMPLQMGIQLDAARQRLQAAAYEQVLLVQDGWENLESEIKLEMPLGGVTVRGKIDRIDRHRKTGQIRVLDYKTSDKAEPPEKTHLGSARGTDDFAAVHYKKRQRRWRDLQLPLYELLLMHNRDYAGPFELGYFNLPKAVADTGVSTWAEFGPALLESASAFAEGVVVGLRRGQFWPPAERVDYDDYATLFHGDPEACFDARLLKSWVEDEETTNDQRPTTNHELPPS